MTARPLTVDAAAPARIPLSQCEGFIPLRMDGPPLTPEQLDTLFPRERVAPLLARLRQSIAERKAAQEVES